MPGRECYHCKQWIEEGAPHNCWTTTEAALTADLSEDLREAWQRLRETAVEFGEQRIYASLNSIMFSRKACYFFVRPKRKYLEVCVFLGRTLTSAQVRRAMPASKTKTAHLIHVRHRDEVEPPLTDWLQEAYQYSENPRSPERATSVKKATSAVRAKSGKSAKTAKRATRAKGATKRMAKRPPSR